MMTTKSIMPKGVHVTVKAVVQDHHNPVNGRTL